MQASIGLRLPISDGRVRNANAVCQEKVVRLKPFSNSTQSVCRIHKGLAALGMVPLRAFKFLAIAGLALITAATQVTIAIRQMKLSVLALTTGLIIALSGVVGHAGSFDLLFDDFEESTLDLDMWQVQQARPGSYWIDPTLSRTGQSSLAVKTGPDDLACDGRCERTEVRIAKKRHISFGKEAWYSFSFLLDGDTPLRENTRWISGQWKEQTAGSPFLAQRFEHGVFHITVQDNDCRVLVAKSSMGHIKVPATADSSFSTQHAFLKDKYLYRCSTDIEVELSNDPTLPEPFGQWIDMKYRVRGGRNGTGLIEIWANNKFIARVIGSIGNDNVGGPMQYFKFGIYRDVMSGTGVAHLDGFKRNFVDPSRVEEGTNR